MRHGSRHFLVVIAVLVAALLAACGSGPDPTPTPLPPTPAPSPAAQVVVEGKAPATAILATIKDFTHQDLTIPVGARVRWANLDGVVHTSSSGAPGAATDTWDSGIISPGGTFTFTFEEPGTFVYFCKIHNTMTATITVTGTGGTAGAVAAAQTEATAAPLTPLGPGGTWTRQYGSGNHDYTRGVAVDSEGRVHAVGWTAGLLTGEAFLGGTSDAIMRTFDNNGDVIATRQFGTEGTDLARGVAVDKDGNVYVTGWTEGAFTGQTNLGRGDTFLIKFGPGGDEVWTRQFGTDQYDLAQAVTADGAGNSYVVGWTRGAFPGYTVVGAGDSYVRKYDSEGNDVWTQQFGTEKDEFLRDVGVDAAGNVYVVGWTEAAMPGQTSAGLADGFLVKLDAGGNMLWTRQFGTEDFDFAQALAIDDAGNIYVGGWTNGAMPGQTNAGEGDAFLRKYDSEGNEVWTWQFGTAGFDEVSSIQFAGADRLYASGLTAGAISNHTNSGARDAFVRSFDGDGNELGTTQFGTNGDDSAHTMALDNAGYLYVGGWTAGALPGQTSGGGNDAFVMKMSPVLVSALTPTSVPGRLWTRQFGTQVNDFAGDAAVDEGGNLYVVGWSQEAFPNKRFEGGRFDAYVRKYSSEGTALWTREFGTTELDIASTVVVDGEGNVYVAGQAGGDLSDQTYSGERDALVRKYDPEGTELWTRLFGTPGVDVASGVALDSEGDLYVVGWAEGNLPGQTRIGRGDGFVVKYDRDGNQLWSRQFGTDGADEALGVGVDGAGNVYVGGYVTGALAGQTDSGSRDAFLRSYDGNGAERWTRQFGTEADDLVLDVAVDSAGNSYLVGNTAGSLAGQTGLGDTDAFVRSYDRDGVERWTRQFGSELADQALGAEIDRADNLYVVGISEGALPGLTKSGGRFDSFVRKYDMDGNELSTRPVSTEGSDTAFGAAADGEGNLYVVGWTGGSLTGQTNLGQNDAFVIKMSGN